MSGASREAVWARLRDAGLVQGDLPAPDAGRSPWFVRVMLGIAGWIGALFLLGFVGAVLAGIWTNPGGASMLGAAACGAAYAMFRAPRQQDFAMQFALALSLAGQALIVTALFQALPSRSSAPWAALCVFEVALAFLMPNFLHRVLSAAAAVAAFMVALAPAGLQAFAAPVAAAGCAAIWLSETRWAARDDIWRPIGYGVTLALLAIDVTALFDGTTWLRGEGDPGWLVRYAAGIGALLTGLMLVAAVHRMLARLGVVAAGLPGIAAHLAAILAALASFAAPGLSSALLVLLVGFGIGNRLLAGLGIAALLGFLSHYYYALHATLLAKSMVLAVTGAVLLAARAGLLAAARGTDKGTSHDAD